MEWVLSIHWALVAAIWYAGNGILHDTFVLINHKGPYGRELLRLLMDGHVLIFSGAVTFVGWLMLLHKIPYGGILSIVAAGFMLVYCLMIFPFLKSFGTMAISVMLIAASIKAIHDLPALYNAIPNYKLR